MVDLLIMAEKSSAYEHMKKAFGGASGTFDGQTFQLTHARGHLYGLDRPENQVSDEYKDQYSSWSLNDMPWNPHLFKWRNKYLQGAKQIADKIRQESKNAKAFVIATDDDPSGEGDLLGWEVVNGINFQGKVYRMRFGDESAKGLQKALKNKIDVTDQKNQVEYLKGLARSRFDFVSMQLTALATTSARMGGYNVRVANQGRLKSVILVHIYDQLEAIKNYVRKPYYEAKYKDDNGHVYSRKVTDENIEDIRFDDKNDAQKEADSLGNGTVTDVQRTPKTQAPGRLLNISDLSAQLSSKGYSDKEILATYQKLYEAELVSYPRTADTKITENDFNDLLPLVDKIADVVGVDKSLLTHRKLRAKHKVASGDHGPNRPGLKVPSSMDSLDKYGKSARDIYELVARNFLSILGEDHKYDQITAKIAEHPEFETKFRVDFDGDDWKRIAKDLDASDDDDENDGSNEAGKTATTFVDEGANSKPTQPSATWIQAFLKKYNIGTGATRVSTMANLAEGKQPLINSKKGKYTLTDAGMVSAVMAKDTWISSVDVTKKLFDALDQVSASGEVTVDKVVDTCTNLVKHDKPIIYANREKLSTILGKPKGKLAGVKPKAKVSGVYKPTGQEITFNKEFGGYEYSDSDVDTLLSGGTIEFEMKTKAGMAKVEGKLAEQTFKGKKFWGIKAQYKKDMSNRAEGTFGGKEINFKKEWGGHKFTADEIKDLLAGKNITFKFKTKKGKEMDVTGKLEEQSMSGHKFFGFKPDFDKK